MIAAKAEEDEVRRQKKVMEWFNEQSQPELERPPEPVYETVQPDIKSAVA